LETPRKARSALSTSPANSQASAALMRSGATRSGAAVRASLSHAAAAAAKSPLANAVVASAAVPGGSVGAVSQSVVAQAPSSSVSMTATTRVERPEAGATGLMFL